VSECRTGGRGGTGGNETHCFYRRCVGEASDGGGNL
jgi:hypothetical protein